MTTTDETPRQRRRRKAAQQHAAYGSYWPGKYVDLCRELDQKNAEISRLRGIIELAEFKLRLRDRYAPPCPTALAEATALLSKEAQRGTAD